VEQTALFVEKPAQRYLAPVKKALATRTDMLAFPSKRLQAALKQLGGGMYAVVAKACDANSEKGIQRKKTY
jgi:hypothetical protein